jgi:hypothetical protein
MAISTNNTPHAKAAMYLCLEQFFFFVPFLLLVSSNLGLQWNSIASYQTTPCAAISKMEDPSFPRISWEGFGHANVGVLNNIIIGIISLG